MKIASSTISATVVHSAMRAQTRHPSLRTWVGADPRQHAAATPDNSLVRASEATRRAPVMERPKPPPVHGDGDAKSTSQSSCDRDVGAITPRLSMLRDLIERMTGIRLQAVHWREATAAGCAAAIAPIHRAHAVSRRTAQLGRRVGTPNGSRRNRINAIRRPRHCPHRRRTGNPLQRAAFHATQLSRSIQHHGTHEQCRQAR